MGKTVSVRPRDDGHDFQESWMVHSQGQMKSNHTTKSAAKSAAREIANEGDTLVIHRTDGTIQERKTVRKGRSDSSDDKGQSHAHDMFGAGTVDIANPFHR